MKNRTNDAAAVLERHGKQLHALLFRLTLRTDAAEDLLQELFCRLAKSDGFLRADNALAFAYRAATNLAFDWRRARKRSAQSPVNDVLPATACPSPLADLVRREELEQTLTAIDGLQPPGREIIVLRYLEQQSYETIAEQFGKTKDQIRAVAHKAITRLRSVLKVNAEPAKEPQETEGK